MSWSCYYPVVKWDVTERAACSQPACSDGSSDDSRPQSHKNPNQGGGLVLFFLSHKWSAVIYTDLGHHDYTWDSEVNAVRCDEPALDF